MSKRSVEAFARCGWTKEDEHDLARLEEKRRAWQRRAAAAEVERKANELYAAIAELEKLCDGARLGWSENVRRALVGLSAEAGKEARS
jgi:hypothetical protein